MNNGSVAARSCSQAWNWTFAETVRLLATEGQRPGAGVAEVERSEREVERAPDRAVDARRQDLRGVGLGRELGGGARALEADGQAAWGSRRGAAGVNAEVAGQWEGSCDRRGCQARRGCGCRGRRPAARSVPPARPACEGQRCRSGGGSPATCPHPSGKLKPVSQEENFKPITCGPRVHLRMNGRDPLGDVERLERDDGPLAQRTVTYFLVLLQVIVRPISMVMGGETLRRKAADLIGFARDIRHQSRGSSSRSHYLSCPCCRRSRR